MLIERCLKAQYAEFNMPTCGKIAVWQLCRERQPLWNSHDSWWPEPKMFGSMQWCSFPWQKLLAAQKTCCTVWIWSMSLYHEGDAYRFAWDNVPRKQAFVDISVFCGCAGSGQDSPKASPRTILKWKESIEQLKLLLNCQMNADWEAEKAQCAEINVPTCGKIAVWQLCRETQPLSPLWNGHDSWWPELKMFGSMPWFSCPWHKLLPRLAQKNCCTV